MTKRARSHRSRSALITLFVISYVAYFGSAIPLVAQVSVNTGGTGNGIVMTNGTDPGSTSGAVTIFADGTSGRGKIYNGTVGSQPLAIWPCTMAGCIVYAASSTGTPETALQPLGSLGRHRRRRPAGARCQICHNAGWTRGDDQQRRWNV